MSQILYPIESTCDDALERFLRSFEFRTNGFGIWRRESRGSGVEGYICDYQIAYVAAGALRFSIHQRPVFCPSGTLILFEPFVVYTTEVLPTEEALQCYSIHFDIEPEHRQKELVQMLLGRRGNVFLPGELPPVSSLFQNLFESRQHTDMGMALQTDLELRLACLYMLRARWPETGDSALFVRPGSAREAELVQEGIAYIKEHISRPLRLGALSKHLNISANYLYKCFMDVLQTSPSRYILQYKIRLSVGMLTAGGATMEEIAERLGFSSPYHFSTTFKQIMGCSPRNYVKESSRNQSP